METCAIYQPHVRLAPGAGGAERRKAMETGRSTPAIHWEHHEPGGQNAERQWRPEHSLLCADILPVSRGGRTPKGNGDEILPLLRVPEMMSRGGRTPKGNGDVNRYTIPAIHSDTSRGGRTPKGNGDEGHQAAKAELAFEPGGQNAERQWRPLSPLFIVINFLEPGGQNAERQWRRRSQPLPCGISAVKPGGRTPKGNGGGTALAAESKQVGAAGWSCPRLALECRTSADVRFSD